MKGHGKICKISNDGPLLRARNEMGPGHWWQGRGGAVLREQLLWHASPMLTVGAPPHPSLALRPMPLKHPGASLVGPLGTVLQACRRRRIHMKSRTCRLHCSLLLAALSKAYLDMVAAASALYSPLSSTVSLTHLKDYIMCYRTAEIEGEISLRVLLESEVRATWHHM